MIVGLALLLLGLAVPIAVVVWIVQAVRRAQSEEVHPGLALRRLLQYGFLLAAVCTAAVGLSALVALALPAQRLAGRASGDLALGLSLSIVAVPVAAGLWRVVRRRIADDPDERASTAWALYLAVTATGAVTTALVGLVEVAAWAFADDPFAPSAAARALVWGAVWAAHQRVLASPRYSPTGPAADLTVLAGSAVGLLTLAAATGSLLFVALEQVYAAVAGGSFGPPDPWRPARLSAVVAVLGGGLWWLQWLRHAARRQRTTLWYGYVLCVPVLGGLLASVGAAATILHAALQWTVGVPDTDLASAHFSVVPVSLAVGLVGAWAWAYHRAVVAEGGQRRRTEPERAYEYVGAAVGLLAASAGVAVALVALIEALAPAPLASADPTGRGVLVTAVTLLVVGGPLWWAFWRRLADPAERHGDDERAAPSRRAYLFLLFGAAGLTAVVSLIVVLFVVLRDAFDGALDSGSLLDVRAAVALALTAGALSAYHWTVYREDRAARPDEDPLRERHVLLLAADPDALAAGVRETTGATVRVLRRLDAPAPEADPSDGEAGTQEADAAAVARAVLACPHQRVLVLVEGEDVRVVPYRTG